MTDQQKLSVPYWHLYTDENGISRQRRCLMTRFELKSMQPPADPQWQGERYHDRMTTMVTPGYAPLARGMAAALPFVDLFVEGHSFDALDRLAAAIAETA